MLASEEEVHRMGRQDTNKQKAEEDSDRKRYNKESCGTF